MSAAEISSPGSLLGPFSQFELHLSSAVDSASVSARLIQPEVRDGCYGFTRGKSAHAACGDAYGDIFQKTRQRKRLKEDTVRRIEVLANFSAEGGGPCQIFARTRRFYRHFR